MRNNKPEEHHSGLAADILSCIGDGVIATDLKGGILFFNRMAEEITGWTAGDAVGKDFETVFSIINANTNEPLKTPIACVIENDCIQGLLKDTVLITRDHTRKYVSATCSPVKNRGGVTTGMVAVLRDVTRLRTSEIKEKIEKDYCMNLLSQLPALIWRTDRELNCNYVNPSWTEFTGMTLEELLMRGWTHIIHPDDMDSWVLTNKEAASKKGPFSLETRILRYDGEYRWCMNTGRPYCDPSGEFAGYIGVLYDITENKSAARKIFESQVKYRSLLMNMSSVYAYCEVLYNSENVPEDLIFAEVNGAFEKMFGLRKSITIGRRFTELLPADKAVLLKIIQKYSNDILLGKCVYVREVFLKAIGRWGSLSVYSPGKSFIAVIISDITHIKESEIALKKAKVEAETANRSKSIFLANMSHEIRTPINGMVGMIDLTLLTDLNEEQRENLNTAKACANSLLNIINDILDVSKLEAGKISIESIGFDVIKLTEEVIKAQSPFITEKGLELSCAISAEVPRLLTGDPYRIRQVLNNLISNAVKFTERGSIAVSVQKINEARNETELEFSVSDTGIGIDRGNIGQLFQNFSQLDSSITKKFGGAGLGLAISKQLVKMMGGRIWVESEKGKGSRFLFSLKFRTDGPTASGTVPLPIMYKAANQLRILLAEDDLVNRKVALKMLEEKGYNVEAACNGMEALELFNRKEFDAVLMDIQMPEMDGIEASRRMREMEGAKRHTPIIALTAYALQGDREKYIGMGMDGYVTKPFQMCDLFIAVERAVSARESRNSIPERVILTENGEVKFAGKSVPLSDIQTNQVLAGIEEHVREAEAALPDNNLQGVEYAAHCIKEMADEIRADGIRTAAFKEELAVRRGDLNAAAAWLQNIRTEVKKFNKSATAAEGGKGYENTRSGR